MLMDKLNSETLPQLLNSGWRILVLRTYQQSLGKMAVPMLIRCWAASL